MIRIPKDLKSLSIENHPTCPKCGSENTETITVRITDYIHRSQGCPRCNDCHYGGMMDYQKIYWGCSEYKGKIVFSREDVEKIVEKELNENINDILLENISSKSLPFDSSKIVDEMLNEEIENNPK